MSEVQSARHVMPRASKIDPAIKCGCGTGSGSLNHISPHNGTGDSKREHGNSSGGLARGNPYFLGVNQ